MLQDNLPEILESNYVNLSFADLIDLTEQIVELTDNPEYLLSYIMNFPMIGEH
jgi:hypothetical protein